MNTTSPYIELGIKFNTEDAFDAGYTALKGNAFSFDNYKEEKTLKFFTSEVRDNAVSHLRSFLVEGTQFIQIDFI